jgi:hypothetical protein
MQMFFGPAGECVAHLHNDNPEENDCRRLLTHGVCGRIRLSPGPPVRGQKQQEDTEDDRSGHQSQEAVTSKKGWHIKEPLPAGTRRAPHDIRLGALDTQGQGRKRLCTEVYRQYLHHGKGQGNPEEGEEHEGNGLRRQ